MIPNKQQHSIPVVYLVTNKINGKIYVGSAKNFYVRFKSYHSIHRTKKGRRLVEVAMQKWGIENFTFSILEEVSDITQLIVREQHYIDTLKPFDTVGYNICPTAGSSLGRKLSDATRLKIAASHKGKGGRAVVQIDPRSNKVVAEYHSVSSAAMKIGVGNTAISRVCRGKRLISGGYIWAYKDSYDPLTFQPPARKKRGGPRRASRPVIQFDLQGNQIRTWDHAEMAAIPLGIHPDGIRRCCHKLANKTAGGYKWEFVTDPDIIKEVNTRIKQKWNTEHGTAIH